MRHLKEGRRTDEWRSNHLVDKNLRGALGPARLTKERDMFIIDDVVINEIIQWFRQKFFGMKIPTKEPLFKRDGQIWISDKKEKKDGIRF